MTFLFEYVSYYIIIILFNDFLNFFSFNLFLIIFHKSVKIVNCFEYFILLFLILINYDFLENFIFFFSLPTEEIISFNFHCEILWAYRVLPHGSASEKNLSHKELW